MQFFSTRDRNRVVNASQAIAQGLSDEGGLFVPQSFPKVDVASICALDYPEMAAAIVGQQQAAPLLVIARGDGLAFPAGLGGIHHLPSGQ